MAKPYPDLPGPVGSDPGLVLGPPLVPLSTWFLCFHHNGCLLIPLACQASSWLKVSVLATSSVWNIPLLLWVLLFIIYTSAPKLPWLRSSLMTLDKALLFPVVTPAPHSLLTAKASTWNDLCVFICMFIVCLLLLDGGDFVLFTGIPGTWYQEVISQYLSTNWLGTAGRNSWNLDYPGKIRVGF